MVYLMILPFIRHREMGPAFLRPRSARDTFLVVCVGFMAFCFAPLLQMTGLQSSRATDNALIVAMEPLMTVLFARIFLSERLTRAHFVAFGLALSGFVLLSGGGVAALSSAGHGSSSWFGNFLMLASLIGEATYSVLSLKLLDKYLPLGIFGSALAAGVGILTLSTCIIEGPSVFLLASHLSWKGVLGLLWLGPLGTAFAYFYWMSVLREASVASIALTLFIQPVLGAVWGFVFLSENLTGLQALGGLAIILGLMTQSVVARYRAAVPL
jgi:drug/metabolite transporter (DMT)-like permease